MLVLVMMRRIRVVLLFCLLFTSTENRNMCIVLLQLFSVVLNIKKSRRLFESSSVQSCCNNASAMYMSVLLKFASSDDFYKFVSINISGPSFLFSWQTIIYAF
mmetsp:Transcript_21951/g.32874  ORF Transcript_21951/g.32874 Transcript_21951/m.32874 type:complete len:103 (+) Transcript_21951:31-339(+)